MYFCRPQWISTRRTLISTRCSIAPPSLAFYVLFSLMNFQMKLLLLLLALAACQQLPEQPLRQREEHSCANIIIVVVMASSSVYSTITFIMLQRIMDEVRKMI